MKGDSWRAAGIADPKATWFSEVARWSTEAAIPVEFVKCISGDEVRTRLAVSESFSVVLVGAGASGVDRSLFVDALAAGAAVIAVDDAATRPWRELGAVAVLPSGFDRDDLMSALAEHALPTTSIQRPTVPVDAAEREGPDALGWLGQLICVTGPGGAGSSTLARSLACELAAEASNRGLVLLADLALNADQAMMHDCRDVFPGLQEALEAQASGQAGRSLWESVTFKTQDDYHLLLGLRHHRDWVVVRRRALDSLLDAALRAYRYVVTDIDPDAEGANDTGSVEVENRNVLARACLERADVVVAVAAGDTKGVCSLTRTLDALAGSGVVDPRRMLPVVNRVARRGPSGRALAAALGSLLESSAAAGAAGALIIPRRRSVERALRDGVAPPGSLAHDLADEVRLRLRHPEWPTSRRLLPVTATAKAVATAARAA